MMSLGVAIKQQIIIVAIQDQLLAQQVVELLQSQDHERIITAGSCAEVQSTLRTHYDQPAKVGLIIINESSIDGKLLALIESFSAMADATAIPFLLLHDSAGSKQQIQNAGSPLTKNHWLSESIATPLNPQELFLSVGLLLKLKAERMQRIKQQEEALSQLAQQNVNDAKLKFLVSHDELTGLLNRSYFERNLKLALNRCKMLQKDASLLFIDIDRFCMINELEGFDIGDRLLVELTVLMQKFVPPQSQLARVGVDEFCLFLENTSKIEAQQCAESIKTAVENFRFHSAGGFHNATVSIGIATLDDGMSRNHHGQMITHARQACHFAKLGGRDKIGIYDRENTSIKERQLDIYWLPIIRTALKQNNLYLVFQPVVDLNSGNISHYEVLLRMRGEDGQIIPPNKFIAVAERTGLIHAIDLWVIENAIDFLAGLPAHRSHVSLAINLSGVAFQYPDLLEVIREKLELTWVDAGRLTFEITETAAVENFDKTRELINKIHALGCKFALDDFGAGFCSFNYLKSIPVDYVKIDGQFIRNLIHDETDQILVKSLVDVASKLGKKTIAEFIEAPPTLTKLRELGVHFGQGYMFGKPQEKLLEGRFLPLPGNYNFAPRHEAVF